jgi:methanogenic corrinoid protein MtbC1
MASDTIPTFNLKAVVQETGLKPDTLRAWERRYGIPEPDRTTGGHRLYSQLDINTLKWMLERQEEGLSISRAVKLWRRITAEGHDPLETMPLAHAPEPVASYTPMELGDTVVELRRSWVDAVLAFDERKAELVLSQAFSYYPPEAVCFELLQKALVEIGNGWYEGTVTVQQEHFASALALRRMDALLAALPAPTRPGRILVGCPPGDNHTFSALLLTFLLRRRGWDVVYLGADVPTNRLQMTVDKTRPDLVVFSGQLLESAASLLGVAQFLQTQNVPLAYGGYIFNIVPAIRDRIPGHFLGNSIAQVPDVIEHLVTTKPPIPAYEPVSPEYAAAYAYFLERHGLLESTVWQILDRDDFPKMDVPEANRYMSRNIAAALRLGDLDYMGANLHWIEGMMINHNLPPNHLQRYLQAYYEAAQSALEGPAGEPILEWLADVVEIAEMAVLDPQSHL